MHHMWVCVRPCEDQIVLKMGEKHEDLMAMLDVSNIVQVHFCFNQEMDPTSCNLNRIEYSECRRDELIQFINLQEESAGFATT